MNSPQNRKRYQKCLDSLNSKLSNGYFPRDKPECLIIFFEHFREYNERFYGFTPMVSLDSLLDGDAYAIIEAATDKLEQLIEEAPFNQELRYKWTSLKAELDDVPELQPTEIEDKEARVMSLINEILFYLKGGQ